jgi:tetratricopeptide (TPR) repeat protein
VIQLQALSAQKATQDILKQTEISPFVLERLWREAMVARKLLWVERQLHQAATALKTLLKEAFTVKGDDYGLATVRQLIVDTYSEALLQQGDLKALATLAATHKQPYWQGYASFLQGRMGLAHKQWCHSSHLSTKETPSWEETVLAMAQLTLTYWPHYLHLRNRLEQTVTDLYRTQQLEPLDRVLSYLDSFAQVNGEVYKLAGRALLYQGEWGVSLQLLHKAVQQQPFDAETYYHLGEWYVANRQWESATRCLRQTLFIYPDYLPAQWLLHSFTPLSSPEAASESGWPQSA